MARPSRGTRQIRISSSADAPSSAFTPIAAASSTSSCEMNTASTSIELTFSPRRRM